MTVACHIRKLRSKKLWTKRQKKNTNYKIRNSFNLKFFFVKNILLWWIVSCARNISHTYQSNQLALPIFNTTFTEVLFKFIFNGTHGHPDRRTCSPRCNHGAANTCSIRPCLGETMFLYISMIARRRSWERIQSIMLFPIRANSIWWWERILKIFRVQQNLNKTCGSRCCETVQNFGAKVWLSREKKARLWCPARRRANVNGQLCEFLIFLWLQTMVVPHHNITFIEW